MAALRAAATRYWDKDMGTREVYRRTVIEACAAMGDEKALAQRLGHPLEDVVTWVLGKAPVPVPVFLQCVDLISSSPYEYTADALVLATLRRHPPDSLVK